MRFHANLDDPRPVNWPVKYPYWITGEGEDFATVVSYADCDEYIFQNWPEATNLSVTEEDEIVFTSRFPKPKWWLR